MHRHNYSTTGNTGRVESCVKYGFRPPLEFPKRVYQRPTIRTNNRLFVLENRRISHSRTPAIETFKIVHMFTHTGCAAINTSHLSLGHFCGVVLSLAQIGRELKFPVKPRPGLLADPALGTTGIMAFSFPKGGRLAETIVGNIRAAVVVAVRPRRGRC